MFAHSLNGSKVFLLLVLFLFSPICKAQASLCNSKQILGKAERILLIEKNLTIDAKIDTGASMSSLSALNIKEVNRNQQRLVQFDYVVPATHKKIVFSKPLVGYSKILKRIDEHIDNNKAYGLRPVIFMDVCIGNKKKRIKVNLIDRTQYTYSMLIGTQALEAMDVVVDPTRKFVTSPKCS